MTSDQSPSRATNQRAQRCSERGLALGRRAGRRRLSAGRVKGQGAECSAERGHTSYRGARSENVIEASTNQMAGGKN